MANFARWASRWFVHTAPHTIGLGIVALVSKRKILASQVYYKSRSVWKVFLPTALNGFAQGGNRFWCQANPARAVRRLLEIIQNTRLTPSCDSRNVHVQ